MEHISFFKPSDVVVEKIKKNSSKKEYCDFSPIPIQSDDETNELIYEILNFHNMVGTENNYIEFSVVSNKDIKIDYLMNKEKYIFPEETVILFLDDVSSPFYITDVSLDEYKYKLFELKTKIGIIKGTTGFHFKLTKPFMYGQLNGDSHSKILIIRKWNKKPYKSNTKIYSFIRLPSIEETNVVLQPFTKQSTYEFEIMRPYNLIVYKDNKKTPTPLPSNTDEESIAEQISFEDILYKRFIDVNLQTYINTHLLEHDFIIIETKKKTNIIFEDKLKKDIDEIFNPTNSIIHNRFIQRLICKSFFTLEICNWLIQETENHVIKTNGWKKMRHDKYSTVDINVNEIPNIFSYIISCFSSIWEKVKQFYCLDDQIQGNIIDIFIVKYSENGQKELGIHKDEGFFTFNILLNNNFEGGGTFFEDGVTVKLEIGDLLVHSGNINHSGKPITKGSRYVLVGFFDIIHKDK